MFRRRQGEIEAKAAEWLVRLGGKPLRDEERESLGQWLGANPAHAAAFHHAEATWADLGLLKDAPGALLDDIAPELRRAGIPVGRRRIASAAILQVAAVVVLAIAGAGFVAFFPLLLLEADYRTAPGEVRSVTLADGSTAQLDSDSALAVRFDGQERRVELLSGKAYFTVAPIHGGETRPFVVQAANGIAKALGTQLMVDREVDGAEITVAEHRVQVSAPSRDDGGPASVVLLPGQRVHYDGVSGMGAVTPSDLDQATAWRRGRLIFDKARLGDVVAKLNRYRHGWIIVADASLADRRVSGVLETADVAGALASIAQELKARTATLAPFVTILY